MPFLKKENSESFPFYTNEEKSLLKSTLILSELERKCGADGYRQPYFFMPVFLNFAAEDKIGNSLKQRNIRMEENGNDIEKLKAMIKENFEEQRKLISKLEIALEAVTSFNGKQMLDSRDMRLMLKVCDRTLIRWRNSGKLPYFKLSGKIYFWASDVHKFLREECKQKDFISDSINS